MKKLFLLNIALMTFAVAPVQAGDFYLMPELGRTDISVNDDYRVPSESAGDDANPVLALSAGWQAANNWLLSVHYALAGTDGLFGMGEHFEFSEVGATVGYALNLTDRFRLVPALGVTSWDLEHTDGEFLNPGPEAEQSADGTDLLWRLGAEFALSRRFHFSLAYNAGNYEFGSAASTRLGFKWTF